MSGTTDAICHAFHNASYVYADPETQLAIVWNGSKTFNLYTIPDCVSVDVRNSQGKVADQWEARERCIEWLTEITGKGGSGEDGDDD